MGTTYQTNKICKHCGFTYKVTMTCWGDCDFEDEYTDKKSCIFCKHIKTINIPKLYPKLFYKLKKYFLNKEDKE